MYVRTFVNAEAGNGGEAARSLHRRSSKTDLAALGLADGGRANHLASDARHGACEISMGRIPAGEVRVKSENVMKLCQAEWQERCLVLTHHELIMTLPKSDEITDKIPLHEIRLVTKVVDDQNGVLSESFVQHALNVHTMQGGYNCGRDYCFGVKTESEFQEWVALLGRMSKAAAKRVANRSRLERYK